MQILKYLAIIMLAVGVTSCNFTETMNLNDDGSGKISVYFDASELMAMGASDMFKDSNQEEQETEVVDSIIDFKTLIAENRDSIMALPAKERDKVLAMENFKLHILMNEAEGKMFFNMFTDFKDIKEANNILQAFESMDQFDIMNNKNAGQDEVEKDPKEEDQENIKVRYDFKGNVFKRDAYIEDMAAYKKQVDSLESMSMFFGSSSYKLEYTFPRRIKSTNRPEATFSADGKTLYYQVPFIKYMADPDLMDIEVVLEN